MQEIFLLLTLLCFFNEGAPFTAHREDDHRIVEKVQTYLVDLGSNLTLPCNGPNAGAVMWIRDGRSVSNTQIRQDGSLFFPSLDQSDSGLYTCESDENESNIPSRSEQIKTPFLIRVRTLSIDSLSVTKRNLEVLRTDSAWTIRAGSAAPPLGLNVTVTPSTIYALVMWEIGDDGGYPVSSFQIRYRLKNATDNEWKICEPNLIHPNRRQFQIYHLQPNSAYVVEMWANNQLGRGRSTILEISTHNDMQEIELGKHLLEGVDTFDTRAWVVAVGVVMGTLCILGIATCCLFYKEYSMTWSESRDIDDESIELMPNIILNPAYDFPSVELSEPDENSNDTTAMRVNNNSVIYPAHV